VEIPHCPEVSSLNLVQTSVLQLPTIYRNLHFHYRSDILHVNSTRCLNLLTLYRSLTYLLEVNVDLNTLMVLTVNAHSF